MGVRMLAPPSPVSEPNKPTRTESSSNVTISINFAVAALK
jgi:hypothetical protein